MHTTTPNTPKDRICEQHLVANERACRAQNITIRVDSMSVDRSYSICSVEQRRFGLFRRELTAHELIWRAEQALAPLMGLGIVPLINVRHRSLGNRTAQAHADPHMQGFDGLSDVMRWLGYPSIRNSIPIAVAPRDPFGWRRACLSRRS